MTKVFIDPGHGGTDPGAVGNGLREKDLNLKISQYIKSGLSAYNGITVKMSRETDTTLSLPQRTNMANAWGADFLLSIHINAGGGTGFESFIYNGSVSNTTVKAQSIIHDEVMKVVSKYGFRDRGKKRKNLHMCRESKMPAVLTENLFIDTKKDADMLKDDKFLRELAQGYVNGIAKLFNLKKKSSGGGSTQVSNKPSDWAEKDWKEATRLGIVDGTRPKDTVTREEAAIMVLRGLQLRR